MAVESEPIVTSCPVAKSAGVKRLGPVLLAVSLFAAGCSPGEVTDTSEGSTPTLPGTSTSAPASSTSAPPSTTSTTTAGVIVEEWVLQPAMETMSVGWTHVFTIPYGDDVELLGTAPGGENLMLGPDYGAQGPDGTWWILDAAKDRLAHYDEEGSYLDQVVLGEEFLESGIYFQYQIPRVLADGRVVASRFDGESTQLLVVSEGEPGLVEVPGVVFPRADDGTTLFGFDESGTPIAVDAITGSTQPTEWFRTQAEGRYQVTLSAGEVTIDLPDIGVTHVVPLVSSTGPGEVHAGIEVATGTDGSIHLYLLGISESDEPVQLAGYTWVAADGELHPMEPSIDPFTPADTGSPSHLGIAYGSSAPWLMIVGEEGVEVFSRS